MSTNVPTDCTECGDTFHVHPMDAETDLRCPACMDEQYKQRHKENVVHGDDDTFSRRDSMERLHWEHRAVPCRLPNGEMLVSVDDSGHPHSHTILRDADDIDGVPDQCPECGYDRFRDGVTDNGVIAFYTVRCNVCDTTLRNVDA